MKQSSNSVLPMQVNNTVCINAEIEFDEIKDVLNLSTKEGPLKLDEKRSLLNNILDHKLDIKEHAQVFDNDSDSNLNQFLESHIPKDKRVINRGSNKQ